MTDTRKGDRHKPRDRSKYMREYMRARRQSYDGVLKPFVAVDGEGGNLDSGYHAYFLLRAGKSDIRPTGNNVRLTSRECLEFFTSLPADSIYVAYFFDYDVTKILEDLPREKLRRLMDRSLRRRRDGRGSFPVSYGEFELDYLPRKEFKVRHKIGQRIDELGKVHDVFGPYTVINDVGSFFQCRFTQALELWKVGTAEEQDAIAIGKDLRAEFTPEGIETIDTYNKLEIKLLAELMEKFRDACTKVGYLPNKWQGPGQLAEAAFQKHGVPLSKDVPLLVEDRWTDLLKFARRAFYGGRPEIARIGPIVEPVFQWDINSAYPYAMQFLPCLIHGEWTKTNSRGPTADLDKRDKYAIWYGSFQEKEGEAGKTLWYGLPVRDKAGSISYPQRGRGWYWNFEVEASIHQDFVVEEAWKYTRCCDCQPLSYVAEVYVQRLSMGKDGPGIVLKLLLNSKYGKTVQSIGLPKYANPIWGSFITSLCRMLIQNFIHSDSQCTSSMTSTLCGKDILMVATDSVCTSSIREDLTPSKELGGWSVEEHPRGMFLIQPGLYFGSSGKQAKTRGVPQSVIVAKEPEFRAAFARMVETCRLEDGDVDVPQRMFCGIRYALHRREFAKVLGQWIEFEDPETGKKGKTIRFDWTTKRAESPVVGPTENQTYLLTFPKTGSTDVETVPYSKDIGGLLARDVLRAFDEAAPDWAPGMEIGDMA